MSHSIPPPGRSPGRAGPAVRLAPERWSSRALYVVLLATTATVLPAPGAHAARAGRPKGDRAAALGTAVHRAASGDSRCAGRRART